MKAPRLCCLLFAAVAMFAASPLVLEAKSHSHVSVNVGSRFPSQPRVQSRSYIVERHPAPVVQQRVYVDRYGRPIHRDLIVHSPTQVVYPAYPAYVEQTYVYPPQKSFWSGFSFGLNFFK